MKGSRVKSKVSTSVFFLQRQENDFAGLNGKIKCRFRTHADEDIIHYVTLHNEDAALKSQDSRDKQEADYPRLIVWFVTESIGFFSYLAPKQICMNRRLHVSWIGFICHPRD